MPHHVLVAAALCCALATTAHAETCMASWYQRGRVTASGEAFRPDALTCAMPGYRAGMRPWRVRVTYRGRSVVCRVNDRGPAPRLGRCIDLSRGAARVIGMTSAGVGVVTITVIGK